MAEGRKDSLVWNRQRDQVAGAAGCRCRRIQGEVPPRRPASRTAAPEAPERTARLHARHLARQGAEDEDAEGAGRRSCRLRVQRVPALHRAYLRLLAA